MGVCHGQSILRSRPCYMGIVLGSAGRKQGCRRRFCNALQCMGGLGPPREGPPSCSPALCCAREKLGCGGREEGSRGTERERERERGGHCLPVSSLLHGACGPKDVGTGNLVQSSGGHHHRSEPDRGVRAARQDGGATGQREADHRYSGARNTGGTQRGGPREAAQQPTEDTEPGGYC